MHQTSSCTEAAQGASTHIPDSTDRPHDDHVEEEECCARASDQPIHGEVLDGICLVLLQCRAPHFEPHVRHWCQGACQRSPGSSSPPTLVSVQLTDTERGSQH